MSSDEKKMSTSTRRVSIVDTANAPPPRRGSVTGDDRAFGSMVAENPNFAEMHDEAEKHDANEPTGLWSGLKKYPKAAAWSILLSTTIVMEGYDTNLIGSFFAFPVFKEHYGSLITVNGVQEYQIPTPWQTGLQNGSAIGSIIGLLLNGWFCDKFGYKKTMIGALIFMTLVIFIPFFAPNLAVLEVGQCLSGLPWGIFQTLAVAYASEVCPTCLRGYLTTYANISWVLGQILSAGVLKAMLGRQDEWAYRIPFALQWLWPVPIMIAVVFAPESPWWLVRHGHMEAAAKSVRRLASSSETSEEDVQGQLSMMRLTNDHEKAISSGTSYWDLFKGVDRRRTEIACVTWVIQNMCGSAFMGYSTYFYEQAGLEASNAFTFSMIQYVMGFIGTIIAWTLMARFGRATLYIAGLVGLTLILCGIGIAGIPSQPNQAASWAAGVQLLIFTLVYNFTVGPVCYSIVSEGSSTRLRQKTVVLARTSYNLCALFINSVLPLMLNPGAWNWGAKTGFFWAGVDVLCILWCVFRLPEFKDRSYHELNILFQNKVPARKFKSTDVDAFRSQSIVVKSVDVSGDDSSGQDVVSVHEHSEKKG